MEKAPRKSRGEPRKRRNADFGLEDSGDQCSDEVERPAKRTQACVPCPQPGQSKSAKSAPKLTPEQRLRLKLAKIENILEILNFRSQFLRLKYDYLHAAYEYKEVLERADDEVKTYLQSLDG